MALFERAVQKSFSLTRRALLGGCSHSPVPCFLQRERDFGRCFVQVERFHLNASHCLSQLGLPSRAGRLPQAPLGLTERLISCSGHLHTASHVASASDKKTVSKAPEKHEHGSVLMQFVEKREQPKDLTTGAKVVQAGKDVTWIFVIIGGFLVTGFLLWSIGSEFFSSSSPSSIFTKALKRVKADPRVIEVLGEPITGHGEESGRGRRRHIVHQEYIVDGVTYMRMKFYVSGKRRKGTVYLDLKRNDQGKYECRFLFVELQGVPPGTIIIEDNR